MLQKIRKSFLIKLLYEYFNYRAKMLNINLVFTNEKGSMITTKLAFYVSNACNK